MRYRLLGERTGLRVSEVALGTGRLGATSGDKVDSNAAKATIAAFVDAGGNVIDTSSAYLGGKAEEMVGAALSGAARDAVVISSKFGRTPSREPAVASTGSHRKALQAEVEGSLRRLGTDRIDILFAHFDDGVTPIDELVRGFDDLVRAGKVLYVGLSNFPAWRIASAAALAEVRGWMPLAVLQLQYNLLERAIEREHLPLAKARGLGVFAWSPLAGGLLGGRKPLSFDAGGALSSEGSVIKDAQAQQIVDAVVRIAAEIGAEPASVAVAWVVSKGLLPVIGPRSVDQLSDNLRALDVQLSQSQLDQLDKASARPAGYPYELLRGQREQLAIDQAAGGRVS